MEHIPHAVDTLSAAIATVLTGGAGFFIGWEGGVRACRASSAYRPFARGFHNRPGGTSKATSEQGHVHLRVVGVALVLSGGMAYLMWRWRHYKAGEAIGDTNPHDPLPTTIAEADSSVIPGSHQTHQLFLYTDGSPEAATVSICLEELGLAYCALPISESAQPWSAGEQERIPILLDRSPKPVGMPTVSPRRPLSHERRSSVPDVDGVEVFGGHNIVVYLCDKYASPLLSTDAKLRSETNGWAGFAQSQLGPTAMEYLYCMVHCPFIPQWERAKLKLLRVLATLERRLRERKFLSGRDFSIADLMAVSWMSALEKNDRCWDDLAIPKMMNIVQWYSTCRLRASMSIGMRVGSNEMFGAYRSYSSSGKVAKAHC